MERFFESGIELNILKFWFSGSTSRYAENGGGFYARIENTHVGRISSQQSLIVIIYLFCIGD